MSTIKFVSDNKVHKAFAHAVRNNVNNYFKERDISIKGNHTLVMQTIVMLGFYIIPFILLFIMPVSFWVAMPMVILMGAGASGIGMCVMHDAVHGSYSSKEWVNKLMAGSMYLLGEIFLCGKLNTILSIMLIQIFKVLMKISP